MVARILSDLISYHFWTLKKVANIISVYPVWKTVKTYNSVTMLGGPYPGRGTVLSQLVSHCEIYVLLANIVDICASLVFMFGWRDPDDLEDNQVAFLKAVRHSSGFAAWVRLLCHSILLNVLDEQCFVTEHTHSPSEPRGSPETGNSDGDDILTLSLTNRTSSARVH